MALLFQCCRTTQIDQGIWSESDPGRQNRGGAGTQGMLGEWGLGSEPGKAMVTGTGRQGPDPVKGRGPDT